MAIARLTVFRHRPAEALVEAVRRAVVDSLQLPQRDPTVWLQEAEPGSSIAGRHTEHLVLVEVTMFAGRRPQTVAGLHAAIADHLENAGVRRPDVLVAVTELPRASWSIAGAPQDTVDVGFRIDV